MSTLEITNRIKDGETSDESQLDDFCSSIETFVNITKLDAENIQDNSVVNALFSDGSITTASIADASITPASLRDAVITSSANLSGTYSTSSLTLTQVSGLSATITTTSRPCVIHLTPVDPEQEAYILAKRGVVTTGYADSAGCDIVIYRDATAVATYPVESYSYPAGVLPGAVKFIEFSGPGSFTYSIYLRSRISGTEVEIKNCKFVCWEFP